MTEFVFLHGGGQGSWIWDETVAALEEQSGGIARCLTLDVPGCGVKRDRDTSQLTFDDIVSELVEDIQSSGLNAPVLVGHSQAGQILPKLQASMPGYFKRQVYVTCVANAPGKAIPDTMVEQIASDPDGPLARVFGNPDLNMQERFRVMFVNDMSKADQDAFLAKLEKDAWPPVTYAETKWSYERLGDAPSTYVLCLQDQVLTPHWQRIYAERFQCERIVQIDAAHQVQNSRPQELAEVLLAEATL